MRPINEKRDLCYRIVHLNNLKHVLAKGLCTKHHPNADPDFTPIGNTQIIGTRDTTPVRIEGYGHIGEYVPFYFTPRSIMLLNIQSGYRHPQVPHRKPQEILIIRCRLERLAQLEQFFFTDGQANVAITKHFNNLGNISNLDWDSISSSNFKKDDDDFDRPRRYQAEFLVYKHVPVTHVESFCVYDQASKDYVEQQLQAFGVELPVYVQPLYYF